MKYELHKIRNDYQVYGEVNGIAIRNYDCGVYYYAIAIRFFQGNCLVKVQNNVKDRTVRNEEDIIKRINRMIAE